MVIVTSELDLEIADFQQASDNGNDEDLIATANLIAKSEEERNIPNLEVIKQDKMHEYFSSPGLKLQQTTLCHLQNNE